MENNQTTTIVGKIVIAETLKGSIRSEGSLSGQIVIGEDAEPYGGEYEVTPNFQQQILETADKKMNQNLTIEQIPYAEVMNPSGGLTLTIGG